MRPTLDASLYLLHLVLDNFPKFHFDERNEALLEETITAILESASRVCTFEANEDVKKDLYSYFTASYNELYNTLKKWFFNLKKSFGVNHDRQWNDDVAAREIKV